MFEFVDCTDLLLVGIRRGGEYQVHDSADSFYGVCVVFLGDVGDDFCGVFFG